MSRVALSDHAQQIKIDNVKVYAFVIPTATSESDGTLEWDRTTMVMVEVFADDKMGIGYTYADTSTAILIRDNLLHHVKGCNAMDITACHRKMQDVTRNLGHSGVTAMAISAIDVALWDLKARLLNIPLVKLIGQAKDRVPVYGSGGFTSYDLNQLKEQYERWAGEGITMFKMKVGRNPDQDIGRVEFARKVIGTKAKLFVDANGSFYSTQALYYAQKFSEHDVSWFEEPVISDDLHGLRFIRQRAPVGMEISAGEYGYDIYYFKAMLQSEAVDVLQADATRCMGITGLLNVHSLCEAFNIRLSTHCAPALHLHACCSMKQVVHAEYFFDHVRIEELVFDNSPKLRNGYLIPDLSLPGTGLKFRHRNAERYRVL